MSTTMHWDAMVESARRVREVEKRIKAELARLPRAEQEKVLARIAVDLIDGEVANLRVSPLRAGEKRWEGILEFCRNNPTKDGVFRVAEVAAALLPERILERRNATVVTIYVAVKRHSVGISRAPDFVMLGESRFRLATEEERTDNLAAGSR